MDQHEVFSWFTHPVYNRYWQHYQQAMSWQQKHKQAYRRALMAYPFPPFPPSDPSAPPPRYSDWHTGEGAGRRGARNRARLPSERPSRRNQLCSESETDEQDTGSDSEIECDVSNMEITEELRQYFAQTEKHREELKKQQQMQAEQEGAYVLADRDLHRTSCNCPEITFMKYLDDTVIVDSSNSDDKLQSAVSQFQQWCEVNFLDFNVEKTEEITINPPLRPPYHRSRNS
ncbi:hypothetical protein SKAU_G00250290 [Synaphobranchus kaupii]|uniref:Gem-associated protein 8 n=1 Tax=Synaphobranchus kaupii TaxID=118154 RepID=A0A9Q1F2N7_SYNKA|nr:hypothetical protein SKAU_G00250290 [Synaphobranchus kaupii]